MRRQKSPELPQLFNMAPASTAREGRKFHQVVLWLRKKGHPVKRVSGSQALVSGRLLNNDEVRHLARELGYRAPTRSEKSG